MALYTTLVCGTTIAQWTTAGDVSRLMCGDIMINQLPYDALSGMLSNVYLRIQREGIYDVHPLMGSQSGAKWAVTAENQAFYVQQIDNVEVHCYYTLTDNGWFVDVQLKNAGAPCAMDLIYIQDIGLGSVGHVRSNEAYNSQYIDHSVHQSAQGVVVCSRQNQPQGGKNPVLQQGCLQGAASFATDGYDVFGLGYKQDGRIAALQKPQLSNRVYQYEFAMCALQSQPCTLADEAQFTFYGLFVPDMQTAVLEALPIDALLGQHQALQFPMPDTAALHCFARNSEIGDLYSSLPVDKVQLDAWYPEKKHEEQAPDGTLLSFFTPDDQHAALLAKELLTERQHGNIAITGKNDFLREDVLATTSYMAGVFHSHVVLGNTSHNMLISNCRNALNVHKTTGQRLLVRLDGQYRLLALPAVYEMGFNYSRWLYQLPEDVLEVRAWLALDSANAALDVRSLTGKRYDFALVTQICPGLDEQQPVARYTLEQDTLTFATQDGTLAHRVYPELTFTMRADTPFAVQDDTFFYPGEASLDPSLLVLTFADTGRFGYQLHASLTGEAPQFTTIPFEAEKAAYRDWLFDAHGAMRLKLPADHPAAALVERMNTLSMWYGHNARVHYASPHGLEQFGGAAWGTRDVSQGPIEYFTAIQRFDVVRDILLRLYTHQYVEDGTWPQWFMFDRYAWIQADEAHGDVIFWPLKCVGDYLRATGDYAILEEQLPYTRLSDKGVTEETESLLQHVKRQIATVYASCLPGTNLCRYGNGDWDDTLQPADATLRDHMVSSWTTALCYQAFQGLGSVMESIDTAFARELLDFAQGVKEDFHKLLMPDNISAGFAVFEEGNARYLLHPRDKDTGITYRLIPMTRSMIAEMFGKQEADTHVALIRKHLKHPDGVRLMNTTCTYRGGVTTYFKRAETAANFGREVGLQYVHAHIRYIEAMNKLGRAEDAWQALLEVNPILNKTIVPNASYGQSNCYSSSSDGMFDNRYEAMKNFDQLRTGAVGVKNGWRVYSSGSGIYLNQFLTGFLGIRILKDGVLFDPALPRDLDGLQVVQQLQGIPVMVRYHVGAGRASITVDGEEVPSQPMQNPYRAGGVLVAKEYLGKPCTIDVYQE